MSAAKRWFKTGQTMVQITRGWIVAYRCVDVMWFVFNTGFLDCDRDRGGACCEVTPYLQLNY